MAKLGQKFKKYDSVIKSSIIDQLFSGASSYALARKYNIPPRTVQSWRRKYINHPDLYPNRGTGSGRPKKNISPNDWKERFEILKKYQAFIKAQRDKK